MNTRKLASKIDHTLLKPDTTPEQITDACTEARDYGFAAVCLNPCYVEQATKELEGSGVKVCTVLGFPLGANTTQLKTKEAEIAVKQGAEEIDFVINIGALKAGLKKYVEDEMKAIVETAKKISPEIITKSIIETCLLTGNEKKDACFSALNAGVDYIKTSTGFSIYGATLEDVKILKKYAGEKAGIKASGGIKDLDAALNMIKSGADRLGTSSGIEIIKEGMAGGD